MERMRPKIKLKGTTRMADSVLSEGAQDQLKGAPVDTDTNIRRGEVFFPVITGGIKRKRAPRTGERKTKEKLSFVFSRASAMQSVPADEDDLLDEDNKEGKEYAEEDIRMTDQRQLVIGSNRSNSELLEEKGTERVQQRQGHIKVKVKTFKSQEGSSVPLEKKQSSDNDNSHESVKEMHNPVSINPEKPKSLFLKPVRSNDRPITPRQTGLRHNDISCSPHCNDIEKLHSYSENLEKNTVQIPEGPHQKHRRPPHAFEKDRTDQSEDNKKELMDALMVVKKIMKMDAAEPFNTPVNPVALGIPDYFDVIDTPMDLGTICTALERGEKYRNSRDVFKDVQFIWENCYKYNSKGDPILDLMKRVKKNFVKYWCAAGLYYESPKRTPGMQYSVQGDITPTHEHCGVDESEMGQEGTGNPDGSNATKTGKINFSAPAQLSGKHLGVRDEQVSVQHAEESVRRAEKECQKTLEATKVECCDQEAKAEMTTAQAIVKDPIIINKGVKLRIKKSKLEIDAQENYGSNNEKADRISAGTDEESALKAGDSVKSLQEETKQQDPHPKVKSRRRHGKYQHKDGCLCAVCNARRRRYEREENALLVKGQSTVVDVDPSEKIKEKVIPKKPLSNEDGIKAEYVSTANLIAHSSGQGNEVKEEKHKKVDDQEQADTHKNGATDKHGQEGRKEQLPRQKEMKMHFEKDAQQDEEKDSFMQQDEEEKESPVEQVEDEEQREEKGSERKQDDEVQEELKDGQTQEEEETQQQDEGDAQQQEGEFGRDYSTDYEIPLQYANPSITKMCEALFTRNHYSLWNHAHSLTYEPSKAISENPILAAISTFTD